MSEETEVLIIGAGPVGLSAALALGRAGIRCRVLERRNEFSRYPKANGVHARTMEIFREWGVAKPIRALTTGMPDDVTIAWMTRLNGIEIGQMATSDADETSRLFDEQSPESLSVAGQHMFEPILAKAAEEMDGVTIGLGCEVVDLVNGPDSVTATYTDADSVPHTIVAQYAIGADGIRSVTRRTLGIGEHSQESLGTAINVQFDADLEPYLGGRFIPIIWIINADTQGAFIRDGATRWRYNFEIPPGADPAAVAVEECQKQAMSAIGETVAIKIHHIWSWSHDLSVTDTWRSGRVFLAGDAAHHFPPHGGFGLNSGVQDAQNIAWKLVARLRWNAGDGLLATYEGERLPVAEFNGEQMMYNTRQMEKTGFLMQDKNFLAMLETPEGASARQAIAGGIPAQREMLASHGLQFGYQYQSAAVVPDGTAIVESSVAEYRPTARPGARAPHSWVRYQDKTISTIDHYNGGFTLLTGPDNAEWAKAADRLRQQLHIPLKVLGLGSDLGPVDDTVAELLQRYELRSSGALLIRPDGFVGFRSAEGVGDVHQVLDDALRQILDLPRAEHAQASTDGV
ncbi:FAD-dependent monooxygenase [Streptomyces sp. NPDC056672]|uniref:FAD-dependent monooxygenase n=1 Tax=Streptomyces sp. NPDC056672 TaxID=3345906 RepID=UPI003693CD8E